MHLPRSSLRASLLVALTTTPTSALAVALQQRRPDVERPRLASGADTNEARAYYDRGLALLERDPATAAAAFLWATRLEPGWAEALHARRVAGFMANPRLLVRYLDGDRKTVRSADVQRLDSLESRAQRISPFLTRDLDKPFYLRYVVAWVEDAQLRRGGRPMDGGERMELEFVVERLLRSVEVSPWLRAHLAESQHKFSEALGLYRSALSQSRNTVGIHRDLAQLFYVTGVFDSSLVHLKAALDELRRRDADRLVYVYESKEFFEHAIGVIHEHRGDLAAAREAYGRAMQEDLSYYPAHLRLGLLALATADTAQALQELSLAVEVAPAEGTLRVTYGALLAQVGRLDEAVAQLRKAVELEPYYPLPYYVLGRLGEALRRRDQALDDYRAFLARASQRHSRRDEVVRRVADLEVLPP